MSILYAKKCEHIFMRKDKNITRETASDKNSKSDIRAQIITQVIVSVIVSLITINIPNISKTLILMPQDISQINDKITGLEDKITQLQGSLDNTNQSTQEQINDLYKTINRLYENINEGITAWLTPSAAFSDKVTDDYNKVGTPGSGATPLSAQTIVAYDKTTNQSYTVLTLANQKVLLPYESNGQEVYFYGQFNENGQWDGDCLINVYQDDELVLITDALYEDGKLLSYQQVFYYEMSTGETVWAYADRDCQDESSTGETYLYRRESGFEKHFTMDSVVGRDMLHANDFRSLIDDSLYAYYNGAVSDGLFNDTTGNAYMVHFFEDGTVKLLYSGQFKDGTFNDTTGNAWYIVKDEDTAYMYYKGVFINGCEDHSYPYITGAPPLTMEEIQNYIAGKDYNIQLIWSGFENPTTT